MNLKSLLCATALFVGCWNPVPAKADPGTDALLSKVRQYVTIYKNPDQCDNQVYSGSYNWKTQTMVLCINSPLTAYDHDTVKHEVWHVIQSCHTPTDAKFLNTVMPVDDEDWDKYVLSNISARTLNHIHDGYPETHWNAEIEAFSAARMLSSEQMNELFINSCVPTP